MKSIVAPVIYWDSSAVLSTLLQDSHSEQALCYAGFNAVHLLSSLTLAEVYAVLSRINRERMLTEILVKASLEALESGPWRKLTIGPDAGEVRKLASKWPLRGADLWHLAAVKTLQYELPELLLLTFDQRLYHAAAGEKVACVIN
jgi:predicted nucleic acid-binding protein